MFSILRERIRNSRECVSVPFRGFYLLNLLIAEGVRLNLYVSFRPLPGFLSSQSELEKRISGFKYGFRPLPGFLSSQFQDGISVY